jgi:hypothetical protein
VVRKLGDGNRKVHLRLWVELICHSHTLDTHDAAVRLKTGLLASSGELIAPGGFSCDFQNDELVANFQATAMVKPLRHKIGLGAIRFLSLCEELSSEITLDHYMNTEVY